MSDSNTNERTLVQLGLATLARELGASEGDVVQIDADGNATIAPGGGDDSGGSSAALVATANLSSAQILVLHEGSVEMAAAPGAGKGYTVLGGMLQRHGGTTPYTGTDARILVGPQAQVEQDYTTWETGQPAHSGLLVLTGSGDSCQQLQAPPSNQQDNSDNNLFPVTLIENQPLVVGNPNSDLVDGDYELAVTVFYGLVDLM